jgi:metal-dependent amidase/aminoacylase/carboxypeptidase family protein
VVNHDAPVKRWRSVIGDLAEITSGPAKLGAEDFAYYLEQVPGAFMFLGARPDLGEVHPQHSSHLRINERALAIGREAMVGVALASLAAGD